METLVVHHTVYEGVMVKDVALMYKSAMSLAWHKGKALSSASQDVTS